MSLTDLSLSHRATVFFVLTAAIVLGVYAYATLPREASPDIDLPFIVVATPYPGASPADVESQVTRELEREVKGVDGLKTLTSLSQEGVSILTAEFISGTDIDDALQKVRDRVDRATTDLPADAEDPRIQEISFSDIPVLQVHLAGPVGPVVLKRLAEDLQDRLESLPGVLRVNLVGGVEREVQVDVDPERLRLYGLSLDDVLDAVRDENVSIPGGDLDLGDRAYAVRVPGEVDEPAQILDFVIEARAGNPVFIRDVATVRFGIEDRTSYARIDGVESVALTVEKRQGANIVEVADAVRGEVAAEAEAWPEGVTPTLLADQSDEIRRMVKDLENNILSGLVLVVVVLMFVMGFRTAVFVGLAIPFSMILTFIAVQLAGMTLNMVVLFSLVLAVGMLVDNAVVVIENIYRHMQEGKAPLEASSVATREVAAAITVSTLTTVGAFAPLLFWPGVVGDFMVYLPMTLSMALAASLLVAFTVNPAMCASFLTVRPQDVLGREGEDGARRPFARRMGEGILALYRQQLVWALDHRLVIIGGTLGAFVLVLLLFGAFNHGIEFFPETEPPQIFVDVEMPAGSRLEKTDSVIAGLEERLARIPDLEVRAAATGAGSQQDFGSQDGASGTNKARITLDLRDREERTQSSFTTMEQVRQITAGVPGAAVDVERPPEGPPVGDPLEIEISGQDFATLGAIAARVRDILAGIPGLVSLDDDFDLARPELVVDVDRVQAARLGLTTAEIARTVRTAVNGTEASVYRWGDDKADIVVRLAEPFRTSPEDLARLQIVTEGGAQIPLSAIAHIERGSALTSIRHKEQRRVVTVSGKVTSTAMAEPVRREARERLAGVSDLLPPGYGLSFGGQSEDEEEAKAFLSKAFLYALLVVLALMVGKFDSLAVPLIIMTSVLMSMIGVLLGLLVTGMPFGIIMTGLGVISLAGIVVNNAIVLLDYGEQQIARGMPRREAVVETGLRRMRPVLLTAITTILGLIPLSTGIEFDFTTFTLSTGGESSQWWRGMGVAVIFGLAFATFLTLVLVPVLYDLLLGWRERRGTLYRTPFGGQEPGKAGDTPSPTALTTPEEETEHEAAAAVAVV